MEIALDPRFPTYSGGLGMLAGDTIRAAADLGAPMVSVTLAHRLGYFRQQLDGDGTQTAGSRARTVGCHARRSVGGPSAPCVHDAYARARWSRSLPCRAGAHGAWSIDCHGVVGIGLRASRHAQYDRVGARLLARCQRSRHAPRRSHQMFPDYPINAYHEWRTRGRVDRTIYRAVVRSTPSRMASRQSVSALSRF